MAAWPSTRDPKGPMKRSIGILNKQKITHQDADALPESAKRFADGARYKIEIPSVEGPAAFKTVIDESKKHKLIIHRISQGSGIMMQTDAEIKEMVAIGKKAKIEVCLFVGPRASWDIGKQVSATAGVIASPTLRGADQLRFALEDVIHAVNLGLRSVLVGDIGLLKVLGQAKVKGDLPKDLILKTSVAMVCNNPATAAVLEDLGASTLNLATDLSLQQIASIRSQVDIPVDVYVEGPDDFGGAVRHYETPDLVRVAAPIYLKFTIRNSPGLYPSGAHIQGLVESTAKERVRRAALSKAILDRYGFKSNMANPTALKLLIFGGNGVLGTAIANKFKAEGYEVTFGVRKVTNSADQFQLPLTDEPVPELLKGQLFDSVVFAQGANNNDSVINYSSDDLNRLFEANVTFISQTTKALILHNLVKHKGKMVILSSFWEQVTRQEKMSYTITKAAVGGLVRSMAVDLGNAKGILVNGLLPGVVDSPMARGLLKPEQIENVQGQTPGKKMVTPSDVANATYLLGCEDNTAISGQSLFVDYGFAIARIL